MFLAFVLPGSAGLLSFDWIAETGDEAAAESLSQLSIILPTQTGSESITTILGLSTVFKFMNDIFIALTYSQEDASFEKLVEIRALIALNRGEEEGLETALKEARAFDADQVAPQSNAVTVLFNNNLGVSQVQESLAVAADNTTRKGVDVL